MAAAEPLSPSVWTSASGQEPTFETLELSGSEAVRLERDVRRRPEGRFSVGGELRHSLPSLPLLMMQLLWLTGL